jgi:drug/metabolite transporter (DMT)-like permease
MENKMNGNKNRAALFFVVIGSSLFSVKVILAKWIYSSGISPELLLSLRMISALPFYLAVLIWLGLKGEKFPGYIDTLKTLGIGLLGYYLASFLDFKGMQYISAGLERMLLYLYPTFVVLIGFAVTKTRVNSRIIRSLALSYLGIGLLFWADADFIGEYRYLGAGLVITAAFVFAFFMIFSKEMLKRTSNAWFTSVAMIGASVAIFTHSGLNNSFTQIEITPAMWISGITLGVFCTVLPSFMINYANSILGPQKTSVLGNIGPVTTLILGNLVLGETLGLLELVGVLLVLSGGLILTQSGDDWIGGFIKNSKVWILRKIGFREL